MSKRTIIEIVAGVSAIGVIAGIVHRSNRRCRIADELIEQTSDILDKTIEVLEGATTIADEYDDLDDYLEESED